MVHITGIKDDHTWKDAYMLIIFIEFSRIRRIKGKTQNHDVSIKILTSNCDVYKILKNNCNHEFESITTFPEP